MRVGMKAGIAACALMLAACATPQVMLHGATSDANGFAAALPGMTLDFTETRATADGRTTLSFGATRTVVDSGTMYVIEPSRRQWTETVLAPTYFPNSSVIKTLGIQTVDRRVAFAQALASAAGTLGLNLNVLDASNIANVPSCAAHLSSQQVQGLLTADVPAGGYLSIPVPGTSPCVIRLRSVGPTPPGALNVASFLDDHQGRLGFVPYAACRQLTIDVSNARLPAIQAQTLDIWVPDTRYVRRARLPHQAVLDFSNVCSAPDIKDAKAPEKSDFQIFSDILGVFAAKDD